VTQRILGLLSRGSEVVDLRHHSTQRPCQRRLLVGGQRRRHSGFLGVEHREQPGHEFAALGCERHKDAPSIVRVHASSEEAALFQCADHAGQRALGDARFSSNVPRLDVAPNPDDPEHDPARPGEVMGRQHRALKVISDRVSCAVDVLHRGHGVHVEVHTAEAIGHCSLGFGKRVVGAAVGVGGRSRVSAQRLCTIVVRGWGGYRTANVRSQTMLDDGVTT